MGVKGSSSYFQQAMATIVLIGLIHIICECYQDDILVYATNESDFLTRLEEIFKRFRKHGITVNPNKCRFGLSTIQFVGHEISHVGINMSSEKRQDIFNIDKPILQTHVKSFIGCAEYFHEHIEKFLKPSDRYEK